jgi:hypothetical protein
MGNLVSATRIRYEVLRTLAFGSITTSYVAIGTPFLNPVRMLKVTNLTNQPLYISTDGINNHDVVSANAAYVYDYGSNKSDAGGLLEESQSDQLYVKSVNTLPTSGSIYVTVIYASQV